ncbi:MAG: hypothetical protein EOO45_17090 [Flavobacterium sp.]|nr:MAG: hypothetical protein EOO45_17090 [Flavobacterium sp.]
MEITESNYEIYYPDTILKIIRAPAWIAGMSFGIGTLLFVLQIMDLGFSDLMLIGFVFVIIALIINLTALGVLLLLAYIYSDYREKILIHTSLLLINIPIAILYLFILFNS